MGEERPVTILQPLQNDKAIYCWLLYTLQVPILTCRQCNLPGTSSNLYTRASYSRRHHNELKATNDNLFRFTWRYTNN